MEGVASATRLHFPEEGASQDRIESFGRSLVELVNRQDPANSILFLKPTLRIPHTGGERIRKGSAEETGVMREEAGFGNLHPSLYHAAGSYWSAIR